MHIRGLEILVFRKILRTYLMDGPKVFMAKEEWEYIIDQTNNRWQFPFCYAAADGKHIGINCQKK